MRAGTLRPATHPRPPAPADATVAGGAHRPPTACIQHAAAAGENTQSPTPEAPRQPCRRRRPNARGTDPALPPPPPREPRRTDPQTTQRSPPPPTSALPCDPRGCLGVPDSPLGSPEVVPRPALAGCGIVRTCRRGPGRRPQLLYGRIDGRIHDRRRREARRCPGVPDSPPGPLGWCPTPSRSRAEYWRCAPRVHGCPRP